jgi:hypothetical protein
MLIESSFGNGDASFLYELIDLPLGDGPTCEECASLLLDME